MLILVTLGHTGMHGFIPMASVAISQRQTTVPQRTWKMVIVFTGVQVDLIFQH